MNRTMQDFYLSLSDLIQKEHPVLLNDFNNRIAKDNPKQVFMWLQSELENIKISKALDGVMTDFFYSIH